MLFYSITNLGTLGGNSSFTRGINNRAQITGNASLPNGRLHAFLWEKGVMADLGFLPNRVEFSRGFSLNENGVVTGESDNNSSKTFVFDPNLGTMQALFNLVLPNPDNMNTAGGFGAGINDANQIIGTMSRFTSATSSVIRGFKFDSGTVRDLGSIDGLITTPAKAWGINNSGVVVGLSRNASSVPHATLWETGPLSTLVRLAARQHSAKLFELMIAANPLDALL